MEYSVITAYAVHGDGGERGTGPLRGIYSTEELAKLAAKGKAFFGADGLVLEQNVLKISSKTQRVEGNTTHHGIKTEYYLLAKKYPLDMDCVLGDKKKARREELLKDMSEFDKFALGLK